MSEKGSWGKLCGKLSSCSSVVITALLGAAAQDHGWKLMFPLLKYEGPGVCEFDAKF